MNIFLDTEFNGHNGELISMGLIDESYRTWYEVAPLPEVIDPWVLENVIPKLNKNSIDLISMRKSLYEYLKKYSNPTIIVDWNADIKHFCDMLNNNTYLESLHYACKFELLNASLNVKSRRPHNALYDAEALMFGYNNLYK